MSEDQPQTPVDLTAWVRKAQADPVKLRQRQVTEILLHAIAKTPQLGGNLYLKGGILMALAYESPRTTADVDFSIEGPPDRLAEEVRDVLDRALARSAAACGYPDLICKVQGRIRLRPWPEKFKDAIAPALAVTIGSARRGTNEEERLKQGSSSQVLRLDISFREPVETAQSLILGRGDSINAYGLCDLIAEKFRAILQQKIRTHPGTRRQDVFDIVHLLDRFPFDDDEQEKIRQILEIKCRERGFEPEKGMISDGEIVDRLRSDWPTLQSEIESTLPDFDEYFSIVKNFYESLPWY